MGRLSDGLTFGRTIVRVVIKEEIRYPAVALAYYAFVSFVPLLMLVVVILDRQLATGLAETAPRFLTPSVRGLVNRSIESATGRTGAGVLAVIVLGWSSTNFVTTVRAVVRRIEGTSESTLTVWIRDTVVILGSLGLAILAIVTTTLLFSLFPVGLLVGVLWFVGLWFLLTLTFIPLYYFLSEVVTSLTAALPGAVIASFGWTVLHTAVQFYVINAAQYAIYGVLTGVIIILTSLYLASAALLTGFIINVQVSLRPSNRA